MSASRRRNTSRSRRPEPGDEPEPIEEELETLEELEEDDLDTLEPIENDSPVTVQLGESDEDDWDVCLTVDVSAMEKSAVPDAVEGPLGRAVRASASQLRWKRVEVKFTGDALIPSSIKELVADALRSAKPLRVIVQRGYPNEIVHEGELPSVRATTDVDGSRVRVAIDTAGVEPEDLPVAMTRELERLTIGAHGRGFAFAFSGETRPAAATIDQLHHALRDAGALRASVTASSGEESVLFDRELEERVHVTDAGGETVEVAIDPAEDASVTRAAMTHVLSAARERIHGKQVRVGFAGLAPSEDEITALCELADSLRPQRMELTREGAEPDVLWPPLLRVAAKGERARIGVRESNRGWDAWFTAFRREIASVSDAVRDRHVSVDWPKGFELDAEIEHACLGQALGGLGPKSIAFTFGGENREPFAPPAVTDRTEQGDLRVLHLETDAGKPAELARAIERRLGRMAGELRSHPVRVEVAGSGALSRTMLRTLREAIENAGASRLELDDHGTSDVLFPSLLTIDSRGDEMFYVAADPSDRDAAQVEAALQRELDGADLPRGASFDVGESEVTDQVVQALIAREAALVRIDRDPPVQVHPEPEAIPELEAMPEEEMEQPVVEAPEAQPAGAERATVAVPTEPEAPPEPVTILGRKADADPPLVLLGIVPCTTDEQMAIVEGKLGELRSELEGRRVLVVLRDGDREFAAPDAHPLVQRLRAVIDPAAAATLLRRKSHFEVVHSNLESLATGAKVRDPRPGR